MKSRILKKILKNYLFAIAVSAIIAICIRAFVFEAFRIPTDFMAPTIRPGDHVFTYKLAYHSHSIERGDVIIFSFATDPAKEYIKRVIGVEGDHLEIKAGILYLNGKQVTQANPKKEENGVEIFDEVLDKKSFKISWLQSNQSAENDSSKNMISVQVPKGHVFVLGDHRSKGQDSRNWGFLPVSMVKGKAILIWFSVDPKTKSIRWDRFFKRLS
ncbi:MAG: signal peptidase I [Bacteriovoracia bacterium]